MLFCACGQPHYARGLCRREYVAAVKRGDIATGRPGRRVGTSSLSATVQHRVATMLVAGDTVSAIARVVGVSRDQIRTVRRYLEALNA